MIAATTPVEFTIEELWCMQSFVRHEVPHRGDWHSPPADLDLNEQIADGIVRCEDFKLDRLILLLNRDHLLALDYVIPQAAATPAGVKIGRAILLKSFKARRALDGDLPTATGQEMNANEVSEAMLLHETKWNRRKRKV